jgi:hypothetical protein
VITALTTPDGRLTPWAGTPARIPGWQAVTTSRATAAAVARIAGGTVAAEQKGEWQARIPHATIEVIAVKADAEALWCRLGTGIFILAFTPWPGTAVVKISQADMPATGRLSVRAVLMETRMGRTVRFLIPQFTAA